MPSILDISTSGVNVKVTVSPSLTVKVGASGNGGSPALQVISAAITLGIANNAIANKYIIFIFVPSFSFLVSVLF
jgi:hypothetical protein